MCGTVWRSLEFPNPEGPARIYDPFLISPPPAFLMGLKIEQSLSPPSTTFPSSEVWGGFFFPPSTAGLPFFLFSSPLFSPPPASPRSLYIEWTQVASHSSFTFSYPPCLLISTLFSPSLPAGFPRMESRISVFRHAPGVRHLALHNTLFCFQT